MKTLKKLKERFYGYIDNSDIDVKDRTFVLFSTMYFMALIVALIIGMFLHEPVKSTLVSLAVVIFSIGFLIFVIKKNKFKAAKIMVSFVMVFVFQPLMFFTKGGLACGAPFTILLGTYYLVLILEGKFRIIMCIIDVIVLGGCWVAAYLNPILVTAYPRKSDFIYSFAKYAIVMFVLTAIITFQTRVYKKEAKVAEEKSKELEEMNKTQNRFFSSMSHEIRTPINTVLGMNELILRQEDASEEIIKDARNIQGAGKMLLALINDILDVSKIEAGKMDIVPVNYNVSDLLSEIVNMIWLKAEEKGLKFNVDIDPEVPEVLFGDEVRIKQILINLLNNAVKYTKEGTINLHMECEFPDTGDTLLKIVVSDTGMGIKPEALPHLFDSFQRVDEEKNRHIEGTGLGLSIVKQLVELMDGEIKVNSVYTQGSQFMVNLKQGISSDKKIGDLNITGSGNAGEREKFEHSFHAPNARILIVDDNEMNLEVERKLLLGTDMTLDLAISGQDALALTLKNRYDVIFMDHLMPQMDGIECFDKIRSQKGGMNTDVPIIVLTANAGGENIELYNNTGFDGYLVKPVSGAQLEDMLLKHLPADKVIGNFGEEMTGASMSTSSRYARKKPLIIATSTMVDLPQHVIKDLNLSIIPYTIQTGEGVFYDTLDVDSEELVSYMKDLSKPVTSEPPTEEDFVNFFSSELKKAHQVFYITLTTGSSREYGRAVSAAKTFENVTIFNSELLSSGTGILVMAAARLAQQNVPVDKMVTELESVKKLIKTSFVVKTTDVMARRERISPFINSVLKTLWLRPVLRMKNDNLGVGKMLFGSELKCYEKYIKYAVSANDKIDTSFVFITYAGMEEEELMWVEQKLNERVRFDHIIFQKASAGITSNCGEGTFGVLYMLKGDHNYNMGALFADRLEEGAFIDETDEDEIEEETGVDIAEDKQEDSENDNKKWYECLDGIDAAAALKNSGSETALESVLQMFYESYEAKSKELTDFYDNEDWENYTIKIHALKSSSRLVGALKLGDDAEALEMAGKGNDIDFIKENHQKAMDEYESIKDVLETRFKSDDDLPEIPADILEDAYGGLSEFVMAKDYDLSRMVIGSVREYKLPDEHDERFNRIQNCLSNMDWDGINDILKEVL